MYSRQEASQIKQEFWTAFGKYMQPVLSSEGEPVNWINYKTGVKYIFFRMNADKGASIAIEITHPDAVAQQLYYEQFLQLKTLLHNTLKEEWNWVPKLTDENGKLITRIYTHLADVKIMDRTHWPQIISFFKPRIIALDEFWNMVKDGFEVL